MINSITISSFLNVLYLNNLRTALENQLHPILKKNNNTKFAAVLIIIFGSEPKVLMTKKAKHLKIHAGEIAFPGGKLDEEDEDLLETALRETREEINLAIRRDQVIAQLEPVTTLNSRHTIIPFVAVVKRLPRLKDNPEVEKILHIPLIPLLKTLQKDTDPFHRLIKEMYTFTYKDHLVWGASARMLKQIVDILSKQNLI